MKNNYLQYRGLTFVQSFDNRQQQMGNVEAGICPPAPLFAYPGGKVMSEDEIYASVDIMVDLGQHIATQTTAHRKPITGLRLT